MLPASSVHLLSKLFSQWRTACRRSARHGVSGSDPSSRLRPRARPSSRDLPETEPEGGPGSEQRGSAAQVPDRRREDRDISRTATWRLGDQLVVPMPYASPDEVGLCIAVSAAPVSEGKEFFTLPILGVAPFIFVAGASVKDGTIYIFMLAWFVLCMYLWTKAIKDLKKNEYLRSTGQMRRPGLIDFVVKKAVGQAVGGLGDALVPTDQIAAAASDALGGGMGGSLASVATHQAVSEVEGYVSGRIASTITSADEWQPSRTQIALRAQTDEGICGHDAEANPLSMPVAAVETSTVRLLRLQTSALGLTKSVGKWEPTGDVTIDFCSAIMARDVAAVQKMVAKMPQLVNVRFDHVHIRDGWDVYKSAITHTKKSYGTPEEYHYFTDNTPLMLAVMSESRDCDSPSQCEITKVLIDAGADLNAQRKRWDPDPPKTYEDAETALWLAASYGSPALVELLLNAGAKKKIKARNNYDDVFKITPKSAAQRELKVLTYASATYMKCIELLS